MAKKKRKQNKGLYIGLMVAFLFVGAIVVKANDGLSLADRIVERTAELIADRVAPSIADDMLGGTLALRRGTSNVSSAGLTDSDSQVTLIENFETVLLSVASGTVHMSLENKINEPMFIDASDIGVYLYGANSSNQVSSTVNGYVVTSTSSGGIYNTAPTDFLFTFKAVTSSPGHLFADTSPIGMFELRQGELLHVQLICEDAQLCTTTSTASMGISTDSYLDVKYSRHTTSTKR